MMLRYHGRIGVSLLLQILVSASFAALVVPATAAAAPHTSLSIAAALRLPAQQVAGESPQDIAASAEAAFNAGRVDEALAEFDRLAALVPASGPTLWQRGIALYYLGRFDECAAQFRSFHDVIPEDLENATWHLLCVARAQSPEQARARALAAGPDARILRTEIYDMVRGRLAPAALVDMASRSVPIVRFYAHLYVGLHADATGDTRAAREHLTTAAADEYRDYGGFMNIVARVFARRASETPD